MLAARRRQEFRGDNGRAKVVVFASEVGGRCPQESRLAKTEKLGPNPECDERGFRGGAHCWHMQRSTGFCSVSLVQRRTARWEVAESAHPTLRSQQRLPGVGHHRQHARFPALSHAPRRHIALTASAPDHSKARPGNVTTCPQGGHAACCGDLCQVNRDRTSLSQHLGRDHGFATLVLGGVFTNCRSDPRNVPSTCCHHARAEQGLVNAPTRR